MVLGVLRKIPMRPRFGNRLDDCRTIHAFKPLQLLTKACLPFNR
jgi:hypothetical protein